MINSVKYQVITDLTQVGSLPIWLGLRNKIATRWRVISIVATPQSLRWAIYLLTQKLPCSSNSLTSKVAKIACLNHSQKTSKKASLTHRGETRRLRDSKCKYCQVKCIGNSISCALMSRITTSHRAICLNTLAFNNYTLKLSLRKCLRKISRSSSYLN